MPRKLVLACALAATVAGALATSGCAPLVVAAAAGGAALVATDRRSAGAQLDDQTIETKIATSIANRWGDRVHVSTTSYNGIVLLTGEASDEATRSEIEQLARSTDRVRSVQDEVAIGPPSTLSSRANDAYVTSLVKARLVENSQIHANHVKVVTERGTVYLMGLVTRAEGDIAGQIASTTSNVSRVVKVFEYIG